MMEDKETLAEEKNEAEETITPEIIIKPIKESIPSTANHSFASQISPLNIHSVVIAVSENVNHIIAIVIVINIVSVHHIKPRKSRDTSVIIHCTLHMRKVISASLIKLHSHCIGKLVIAIISRGSVVSKEVHVHSSFSLFCK